MVEKYESFETYLIKHISEQLPNLSQPVYAEVNKVFYEENVGGVLYQFEFEFPSIDDMPLKKSLSGKDIPDFDKVAKDTIIKVQRVFPDGEVIVDFEFGIKGKRGDWETRKSFEKLLTEGKGMKGVLLDYYDTFPVETTLPTTLENDITIPDTPKNIDTPTNVVNDFVNYIRNKYKEHFITKYDSMFGPVEGPEAGFNMYVKEDGTVLADRLYLKAESQKKGIGTSIVQEMFDWSNKNNQPFEFILMAGYEDLSSPSKTVQTQKAFQEKLKDVPGLEAFPSEQGLLDTNITTYKYTPQLDTPTNVVDDVTLVKHTKTGKDVVLSLDENGNVILYRSTDDPYRIINSDFLERQTLPFSSTGSRGFGNNSYFASSPTYSFTYELTEAIGGGKTTQNYKYVTNIKVNEILPLQQKISDTPELAKVLGVPETYYNSRGGVNRTWQNLLYSPNVLEEMGYDRNLQGKDWLQDNIDTFKENGIKAIGNDSTGRGSPNANYTEYEIIPLVKDEDIYDIKPVSVLENTTSTNPPKKELKFTETPIDTPTNVVDDVVIAKDDFGRNVTVPVDENGNVILYRATDNPEKIKITNFTKQGDIRSAGLGRNTYFTTNADYSFQYAINRNNIDNFKYTTNIKPNEILNLNTKISDNIELAKALGVPEEFWVFEWRRLFDDKIANRMGFASGTREFFNKNINTLIENGYKALGTSETGTGVIQPYAQYEIVPLITENNNYNIKPISKLTQEKEINGLGVYNETPIDTPTNEVFDKTPGGSLGAAKLNDQLVFESWVDNYANTTTSFVDNLPLVKPVKDMFLNAADNRIKQLARQAATPGGILDAVDIYEIAVLTLVAGAIAYNEIDEIPKITKNAILRTYNLSQGRPIDAPVIIGNLYKLEISEYDIDFEYAMETYERGERVLPYDRIIKHLQGLEVNNDYVSTYLPKDTTDKDKYYNPYQERVEEVKELTANIKREKVKQDQLESKGVQEEKMFKQAKPKKSKATGGAGAKIL